MRVSQPEMSAESLPRPQPHLIRPKTNSRRKYQHRPFTSKMKDDSLAIIALCLKPLPTA